MINNIFNSTDRVNLIYGQSGSLSATRLGLTSPAIVTTNSTGDTVLTYKISLNQNILPGASQDLTAVTILHEAIHGYLNYQGLWAGDALAQHVFMSTQYVNSLTQSLQAVFPNLSTRDANALILYEMGDISTTSPTAFANIAASYGLTQNDLVNISSAYKNGSTGTKCH